jgi:hypothetical protein
MTQPVSSGARWPGADLTCSDSSREESEPLTCEEPRDVSCEQERAHRVATAAPRDGGAQDGAVPRAQLPQGVLTPGGTIAPPGLDFCRRADTVVEGFLCNDPMIVSNACRKPTNAFDEFVCDDPRMQRLERAILRETWNFVKAMLLMMIRRP